VILLAILRSLCRFMKYRLLILFRPPESSFPPAAEVILQLAGLLFQVATFMIDVSLTTGPLLLCRIQSVSEDLFLQAVELATRATDRRQPTGLANRLLLLLPGSKTDLSRVGCSCL
jgi:hypothetical protein